MTNPGTISSNFGSVDDGAAAILANARQINTLLEDFHKYVTDFVTNNWDGAANDAFTEMQNLWHTSSQELAATLEKAATTVRSGNDELKATDTGLAGLF